jgi:hypothetical protein
VPVDEVRGLFEPGAAGRGGRAEDVRTHESLNDWTQGRESMLVAFLSSDHTYANVADRLLGNGEWDFAAVYFRGIDVVSHLMGAASSLHDRPVGRGMARYAGALEGYYRLADGQLQRLLERVGPDTDVVVCSDHGFAFEPHHGFNHVETAPDGVLLFHGPDAAHGSGTTAVQDIAPTLLHLLAQPVPRDMKGQVRLDLFAADSPARQEPRRIATYEHRARLHGAVSGGDDDERIHDELRALGYVN